MLGAARTAPLSEGQRKQDASNQRCYESRTYENAGYAIPVTVKYGHILIFD
jgi:hypothetical protein